LGLLDYQEGKKVSKTSAPFPLEEFSLEELKLGVNYLRYTVYSQVFSIVIFIGGVILGVVAYRLHLVLGWP
jgi:hypothetical protein